MMCNKRYTLLALLLLAWVLCVLPGCGTKDNQGIQSLEQLNETGRKIGVGVDCPEEQLLPSSFPKATILSYGDDRLGFADVASGRLDAYIYSRRPMELAIKNGTKGVRLLDEAYCINTIAVAVSPVTPIPDFLEKLNAFIAESKADGTLEDMYDRWVLQGDETMPHIDQPENPSYRLRVATTGTVEPYTYYVGTELSGYDIELAYRFAAWLGAELELKVYDFGGIVAAATSGSVDCIMSNLYYTPEHDESLPFSDPLFEVEVTAMVRDTGTSASGDDGFWASVKNSFEKTFVREDRWKLFVQGIGTTLLITAFVIVLGTLLGFAVFMLCRTGNPIANNITRFSVWLVQGMPTVVLLMILYYVVFGHMSMPGIVVAVIGFTLVFGASVYGMVKAGVGAIDSGQLEAAYTLGYSNRRAFFRVILPQAMPHFMPAYKAEVSAITKATAVVGYIAVQDLTKMGDIVRSRTYEAFFPLIAVAIFYFILAAILNFIVSRIERRLDPRQRSLEDIKKEVEGR